MTEEIYFNEEAFTNKVNFIKKHGQILIDAASELKEWGLKNIKPNDILDGEFVSRAKSHTENQWRKNEALSILSFQKYLELTEISFSKFENLENAYHTTKNTSFVFYPFNNEYYERCKYRYPKELEKAGKPVEKLIGELFEIRENQVKVHLENKFFKLYATSRNQINQISHIHEYIKISKELNIDFKLVRESLKLWIKDLSYDLSSYKINYDYVLLTK